MTSGERRLLTVALHHFRIDVGRGNVRCISSSIQLVRCPLGLSFESWKPTAGITRHSSPKMRTLEMDLSRPSTPWLQLRTSRYGGLRITYAFRTIRVKKRSTTSCWLCSRTSHGSSYYTPGVCHLDIYSVNCLVYSTTHVVLVDICYW